MAVCTFEAEGVWRLVRTGTSKVDVVLLSFSTNGRVTLFGGPRGGLERDFEPIGSVEYELEPPLAPERIEFTARRGIEMFPTGTSVWEITTFGDESFTVRTAGSESALESQWARVRTHRYFLTLAASEGTREFGGPAAFAMWTQLDERHTKVEGLGAHAQKRGGAEDGDARFGRIPSELAGAFETESDRDSDVMLRIELNEAEYLRAHRVFEAWGVLLDAGFLSDDDPYRQATDLITATLESANACGKRIGLGDVAPAAAGSESGEMDSRLRSLEIVRSIRKANDPWHVGNRDFPSTWRPGPVR